MSLRAVAILLMVLISSTAHAAVASSQTISLNAFIAETIRNNPTVKAFIKKYGVASGEEYAARGIDDVQLESLFEMAYKENPALSIFSTTREKQIGYGIALSKIFSQTGTRLRAGYDNSWNNNSYPPPPVIPGININFTPQFPLYFPSLTLALTQPLLKNIAGIQDSLNLKVSRLQLKTSNLVYQESIERFISEMTALYLRWLNAYNNANTFERVYYKISEQVSLIKDEVNAKVAEESDYYRVLEQQALYKAAWEGYLAEYQATTREVAAMMYPMNPPNDLRPAKLRSPFYDRVMGDAAGMEYLKQDSRLSGILDLSLEIQDEILYANKNARWPVLDAYVKYRRHGASGSFTTAHGSAFNNDDVQGGLQFSVPITNRAARGTYRAQQAQRKRVQYENERRMLDATSQLSAQYERSRRLKKQVEAYEQQFMFGRKKLDEEYEQYTDGRLTLFQLLLDTTDHLVNSVRLEDARTSLAQSKLIISELTDRSLASFQNVIDEVLDEQEEQPAEE